MVSSVDEGTARKLWTGVKQLSGFLGRSFVTALDKLSVELPSPAGLLVYGGGALSEMRADWDSTANPEKPYLNAFEQSLRLWLAEALGPDERMVVFIDDLDRCLPGVALEVLEALKLYLDIPRLVFVVGVDRAVIDGVVTRHYSQLGLGVDKGREYLAKMFQVEVSLAPTEPQIERFLLDQLELIEAFEALPKATARMFQGVILRLALRNPREIKRLINSALMRGLGAASMSTESGGVAYSFEQGLQLFFVHRVLSERYGQGELVGRALGDRFFGAWSRLRHSHRDAPRTIEVPEDGKPGDVHAAYRTELDDPQLRELWPLLADDDLGALMAVDYPGDTRALGRAMSASSDDNLIFAAAARWLDVDVTRVTQGDLARVESLNLAFSRVRSLLTVAACTALKVLVLSRSKVSDLSPLARLANLERLLVDDTAVRELGPLHGLRSLVALKVDGTRVTDLSALSGLTELRELGIGDSGVQDLRPLGGPLGAQGAQRLEDQGVGPLAAGRTATAQLPERGGRAGARPDTAGALPRLDNLAISDTPVADLSPLSGVSTLRVLDLTRTQVRSLRPLHGLARLKQVSVGRCPLDDGEVAALRAAIPGINIVEGVRAEVGAGCRATPRPPSRASLARRDPPHRRHAPAAGRRGRNKVTRVPLAGDESTCTTPPTRARWRPPSPDPVPCRRGRPSW